MRRLSDVEQHTMLATWRLGKDAFGAAVQEELERITGRRITVSAIYSTMIRLEDRGLVASSFTDPSPVRGGKARRLFTLTESGIEALHSARHELDRLWDGLDAAPSTRAR